MSAPQKYHLSIVIPAYNEESNIASTLEDIANYLKNKPYEYEIVIVNDGSNDKTVDAAKSQSHRFKHFTLLDDGINRGKGYAVQKGILSASGEYILFMDADNSTRIDQLDKLLTPVKEGFDVAIASRRIPGAQVTGSQPVIRIVLGNIYILLSKLILGTKTKDYNCGFKLYSNKAAQLLFPLLKCFDWSFDSELIYLIGKEELTLKEVPVVWQDKKETSKVKPFRDGIKSFLSLIKIRLKHF